MKLGNWLPISKAFVKDLPLSRPYTRLEAAYSLQYDYDNKNSVTVAGYSALWSWSRTRVSKFLVDMNVVIDYPEKTQKRRNQKGHIAIHKQNIKETYKKHIRLIENSDLDLSGDIKKTDKKHKKDIKGSTTIKPIPLNPNPNPKTNNIYDDSSKKIITRLNKLGNKKFRFGDNNTKHIIARLKEGFSEDDCLKVLEIKIKDPYFINNPQHYNPETLFRPSKFEKYLNEDPTGYKKDESMKKNGFTQDYYKPASTGEKNEFF